MTGGFLTQVAVFLAAAAIAAPIAKKLNISSVLGYLAAGILIGPFGLGFVYSVYQVENILHIAEFGVALLLFLIGFNFQPAKLVSLLGSVGILTLVTCFVFLLIGFGAAWALGFPLVDSLIIGAASMFSSTIVSVSVNMTKPVNSCPTPS